jgi:hypothetical protein
LRLRLRLRLRGYGLRLRCSCCGAVGNSEETRHKGRAITNNDREQRGQGERRNREKEGEETTRSEHQLQKRRGKRGTAEEQNGDHNQRCGSTHRNKDDYMGGGGAHHEVGRLSRKPKEPHPVRWTTTKGTLEQPREHQRGPKRMTARKKEVGVRKHERSSQKTHTTGGARG